MTAEKGVSCGSTADFYAFTGGGSDVSAGSGVPGTFATDFTQTRSQSSEI